MAKKSTEITQEMMKNARTSGNYEDIWTSRGKCVFCDLKDKYILLEENGVVLTISLYPYIDGHLMAIPRRHVKSPKELSKKEWETMRKFNYIAKKITRKTHGHKGMWTLVKEGMSAQSTVADHLHMHFIPFDDNDLCKWNYRDLKNTPIENVAEYKSITSKIKKYNHRYEHEYKRGDLLSVVVDILMVDKDRNILLQERPEAMKFKPNYLSLPGGHVDDPDAGLLAELSREVSEELNYELDTGVVKLLDSRISTGEYANHSKHLDIELPIRSQFLWNTYYVLDFVDRDKLSPGDDCKEIVWMPIEKALVSERVSPGVKEAISQL